MNNEELRELMLCELNDSLRDIKKGEKAEKEIPIPTMEEISTPKIATTKQILKHSPDIAAREENKKVDVVIMETLMANQRYWLDGHEQGNIFGINKHYNETMALTAQIIDNQPAKHFIGIQPMKGPVSSVFVLEMGKVKNDSDTISLNVNNYTVEARTRKLIEQVALETYTGYETINTAEHGRAAALEIYTTIRSELSKLAQKETVDMKDISGDIEHISTNVADIIGLQINKCANEIGRNTRSGCGNFIIASETIANILMDSNHIKIEDECTNQDYGHVKYVGTLYGTIRVYNDVNMEREKAIVGYKGGSGEIDAGYFHCPYVPLMYSTLINPTTFLPIVSLMTRYGTYYLQPTTTSINDDGNETITKLSSNYYTEITFKNLPIQKNRKKDVVEKLVVENTKSVKNKVIDAFEAAMELLD